MSGSGLKAICFDYYGTLVDIGEPFLKIREWFKDCFKSERRQEITDNFNLYFSKQRAKYITDSLFLTGNDILEKSYIKACDKFNTVLRLDEFNSFIKGLFINAPVFDDVYEVINELKKNYIVAVITNADNDVLYENISNNKLSFDFVVSSEDELVYKPDHMIFKAALNKMQLKADEVVMIGDSISEDILPSRDLGFRIIWINRRKFERLSSFQTIDCLKEVLNYV